MQPTARVITTALRLMPDVRPLSDQIAKTEACMTKAHKARVLYSILEWATMVHSKPAFKRYADSGNLDGLWTYFQNSLRARTDVRRSVESSGEVSLEMFRPAMEAVY